MAQSPRDRRPMPPGPRSAQGLRPPAPRDGRGSGKKGASSAGDTAAHAREVREVARGRDIVEPPPPVVENKPPAFQNPQMLVVRSWLQRRPLEPTAPAAALVHYPRLWATKRGRYCRFQPPGAGCYGLLRARPTF